jgi:putative transposase
MPRNARCIIPELAYHVTQRGTNRQRVFFSAADRTTYLRLLQQNLAPTETRVVAWCLMTNHVHLVVVPGREDSLEVLLRRLHGRYAQMVNARRLRSGHLWQNRFFSCPLSASHLLRVLAYVERNPVRAGLVAEAEQYQWSSAAIHLGLAHDRLHLADVETWRQLGGAEAWRSLLATPDELTSLRLLRRCTYAGRPFGDDTFVKSLEDRFHRNWRRWGFEEKSPTDTSPGCETGEHVGAL